MSLLESIVSEQIPALLGAVIESAPTALVMIDAHGLMVLVNSETEHLFGFARAELLGQSVEMLVPQRFRGLHPTFRT
ncbi:MAG: PAS domain S-box protein, partial [Gammaproteobacteria bacterium]|nr:PAS domain S-box protein [Gammaproteobacteria bacterium]